MPLGSKVFVSGSYVETGEVQVGVFAGQFVGSGCIVLLREVALRKPNNKPIGNDTDQLPRQDLTKPELSLTEKGLKSRRSLGVSSATSRKRSSCSIGEKNRKHELP